MHAPLVSEPMLVIVAQLKESSQDCEFGIDVAVLLRGGVPSVRDPTPYKNI